MMTNLTRWIILVSILSLCFSCNSLEQNEKGNPEPNYNPYILKPGRTFKAEPTVINLDTLEKPDPIPLKREIVNLGKQVTYPRKTNIQPAPEPKFYPITSKVIPKDSVPEPKRLPLEMKEVPFKWPNWEPANLVFKEEGQYNFAYLDVNRGLKSNFIFDLLEDRHGNIWIATWGGGVSVWDGKGFRHLGIKEGLASNVVLSLMEDRAGNIWIGTFGGGVNIWDGHTIKQVRIIDDENAQEAPTHVWRLLEDKARNIWLQCGLRTGLYKWEFVKNTQEILHIPNPNLEYFNLLEDQGGVIWATSSSGDRRLYSWDGNTYRQYWVASDHSKVEIGNPLITQDKSGNIWLGMDNGLGTIQYSDKGKVSGMNIQFPIQKDHIDILVDAKGNIWSTQRGEGVSVFVPQNARQSAYIQSFKREEGLATNSATCLLEDRFGNIWIGTNGGGVNMLKKNAFKHFAQNGELSNSFVRGMTQDNEGNILLGVDVSIWNNNKYSKFLTLTPPFDSEEVWENGIIKDRRGSIWLTHSGGEGLFLWDRNTTTSDYFIHHLPSNPNQSLGSIKRLILEDQNKNFWLFGNQNIYVGQLNKEGVLDTLTPLLPNNIISKHTGNAYEDLQGRLWLISGEFNLAYIHDQYLTHFSDIEEFKKNEELRAVVEDDFGHIWVASSEGLFIWDGIHFTHYTEAEGLPTRYLRYLVKDPKGNIWVGSVKGLTKFSWNKEIEQWEMEHFGSLDGMANTSINKMIMGKDDVLWMSTGNGFSSLDLKELEADTLSPIISIEDFQPLQGFVDWGIVNRSLTPDEDSLTQQLPFSFEGTKIDSIIPFKNLPANPSFPHHINDLSIRWSAKAKAPHRLQYSFMLEEGGKGVWSPLTKTTSVDDRDLSPGKYTFKVRAVGGNGKWSETAAFKFTIRPPWWLTWWAYMGYFILGAVFIWGIIRWQTFSLRKRVFDKTQQIRDQQRRSDDLLQNILPAKVAQELKDTGETKPVFFEDVSILFADFKGFTNIVASIPGKILIQELDDIFNAYDDIMEEEGLEKIQTVGDAYLAACGLPTPDPDHAVKCVRAAKRIIAFLEKRNETQAIKWTVRIGIHSGSITAGVIGKKKFSYDLFGDTINVAARIESASEPGRINISAYTYRLIQDEISCTYRGKIDAKGKGALDMYFVD